MDRRDFLQASAAGAASLAFGRASVLAAGPAARFDVSLAEWSLHRMLFGKQLDHLDFASYTSKQFGIRAVEYVNQFFKDKARDQKYLDQMKTRAADAGVRSVLIMIDGEGALGDADEAKRHKAVENHRPWLDAAKHLGCHSIRVNARSQGTPEEQARHATDGLRRLAELAQPLGLNVLVENHGGMSSNGKWLAGVIAAVNLPNCGTLPDFGNFRITPTENYDRYEGVRELMPYAKAVSAKTYDFDEHRNETTIDYPRMMKIVLDAGYHGYVGIEYEGKNLPEPDGIRASLKLLERVRQELG